MFTTLSRILTFGLLGFKRNGWLSTATISILIIALIVFQGLIVFRVLMTSVLDMIRDKIDVSVSFRIETPEDDILAAKKAIESLAEVKNVDYISRDKALELLRTRHAGDESINQALEIVGANPLPASLDIKAYDTHQYTVIVNYLKNASFSGSFKEVSYQENAPVIERVGRIIDITEKGGLAIMAFLALVATLVTFNTIRLAIYSSREEIGIMRLVGASNFLIRGPYMVEGIIYGGIAAVISMLIIVPLIYFTSPHVRYVSEIDLWKYFVSTSPFLFLYQVLFGVGLGIVSSFIAVRKYLRI